MANIALKAMAIAIAIPYWSGRYRARIFAYCCPAKAQLIPSASKREQALGASFWADKIGNYYLLLFRIAKNY